jgi:hypothetical protein
MKSVKFLIICAVLLFFSLFVINASVTQFVPPDVTDCIVYDEIPFFEGIIPEGVILDTSCGDMYYGYTLTVDIQDRYYCYYTGLASCCYLIQTSDYWGE